MAKMVLSVALVLLTLYSVAQKKKPASTAQPASKTIPLKAENWEFKDSAVQFSEYKSVPAMKILPNAGKVVLKMEDFTDGTIEFDHELLDPRFASFYFHYQDWKENECFYFRTARAGDTTAIDAIQYAPHIGGINLWDMLYEYQTNANFKRGQWNHVKFVISGKQMRIYVNSQTKPTLEVARLEGNSTHGTLAFEGESIISNLVVKPGQVEGLNSEAGLDPTDHDPRYLRSWQVSTPINTPPKIDFNEEWIPNNDTKWEPIQAERRGLINLTRKFGGSDARRFVWLKTTINSPVAQTKKMHLGFSDEVWVILNGRLLYVDKNWYLHPVRKDPEGRCSVDNSTFNVPLQAGNNDILIGVGNNFYGWGIMARLDPIGGN